MGVRRKVSLGFVAIAIILFISGVIAIFEFSRISRSVTRLISDNISSVEAARSLLVKSDSLNQAVLKNMMSDTLVVDCRHLIDKEAFKSLLVSIRQSTTTVAEQVMTDSIVMSYEKYTDGIIAMSAIPDSAFAQTSINGFSTLYEDYLDFSYYSNRLIDLSHEQLKRNSIELKNSFYRSIMPGVVSVAAGILLVILFNYFINLYLLSPIILITKGIKSYRNMRKPYNISFENDDELQELNGEVKEIINENRKVRKVLDQLK